MILALVTLAFFGLQAILGSKLEMIPEMNLPMLIVAVPYPGASPADLDELVSRPLEESASTLENVDTVYTISLENISVLEIMYKYGTNMDKAYNDLKKVVDAQESTLPEDAQEPIIISIDINSMANLQLAVSAGTDQNLQQYVEDNIVPELEKLSSVGQVSLSGGRENYIRVELISEKLAQYNLDMAAVNALLSTADFTIPAGYALVGRQELSLSVGEKYDRMEQLGQVTIPTATGDVIHLSDIANIYQTLKEADSLGRFNGQDTVTISVQKAQDYTAVDVSRQVLKEVDKLKAANPSLNMVVVQDGSEMIMNSIVSVLQTMAMAILLSMLVLFIFYGEWRASVIVGASIPISVFLALIAIRAAGFSFNVVSLGSLVLGVGMMVDNSIVVLESCFRVKKKLTFFEAALEGSRQVIAAVFGSTATTCVVFIPIGLLAGLTGQLFKQLGFTIVFCMVASLVSAVTIVPMCYIAMHPREREEFAANRWMSRTQDAYRRFVRRILPRRKTVVGVSILLLVASVALVANLGMELMPNVDEGTIAMSVTVKPGMSAEEIYKVVEPVEEFVAGDPDVDRYMLTYGSSGLSIQIGDVVSITAYLVDKPSMSTADKIAAWKQFTNTLTDCTVTMESTSSMSMGMATGTAITIALQSPDLDALTEAALDLSAQLREREDITKVHSELENAAPIIRAKIDPVLAQAEGLSPAVIGGTLYNTLNGMKAMDLSVNGNSIEVRVEYPEGEYDSLEKLRNMMLYTPAGRQVMLSDLAEFTYEDSPVYIWRANKQYQVEITAQVVTGFEKTAETDVKKFVAESTLPVGVAMATSTYDEMMTEELAALGGAILTAIFLIFIVMAMQFESPKFSLMVMISIPFSLIGAFGLLFLAQCKINMVSMMGFLMMIGTVVNNAILYVDTANQERANMPLMDALVEAGAIRIRPILMTTLTTVLAMMPMCVGYGRSGKILQGLALVNVGGLLASTILSLTLLPTFYLMFDKTHKVQQEPEFVDG